MTLVYVSFGALVALVAAFALAMFDWPERRAKELPPSPPHGGPYRVAAVAPVYPEPTEVWHVIPEMSVQDPTPHPAMTSSPPNRPTATAPKTPPPPQRIFE